MKLINNRYEQHFDFENSFAWALIVENSKEYLNVVEELYKECFSGYESDFVLSENSEILDLSKNCLMLHNYFDLDINNKKIINEINAKVADFFKEKDFIEDFYKLNQLFISINDKIIDDFDFKLEYDGELTYDRFIKLAGFKISQESEFAERIMSYIKIYTSLKKTRLIVFVGLSDFLSCDELKQFLKELNYLDLKCLLVESHQKYNFDFVKRVIIDDDLCEI